MKFEIDYKKCSQMNDFQFNLKNINDIHLYNIYMTIFLFKFLILMTKKGYFSFYIKIKINT
jgi:hypothetical protein